MRMSPDEEIFYQIGFFKINFTLVTTWFIMIIMVAGSILITRKLKTGIKIPRWQNILEIIVLGIKNQIEEVGLKKAENYIGFLGTLFLFLFISNLLTLLPVYEPPTGSLSTTAALAVSVFFAVPAFNIREFGIIAYLKSYLKPTFFMLPFHIINEFSRTVALAVRLFGNMMSGLVILAILISITPLVFPIIMSAFGLLVGTVQAYIFSILASVFIAAAAQESGKEDNE
jgi:F-type H+-transporting ATPase subunit a